MIDLHMHTTNSDGLRNVKQTLEKAEELKLTAISITDHENCDSYEELKNEALRKIFSGKIIPGVEIKCAYKGRIIDILGFDIDTQKMNNWLKEKYKENARAKTQEKYLKKHYQTFKNMGAILPEFENIKWDKEHDWANPVIYYVIKENPENEKYVPEDIWESFENFRFKYCYNPESEFYIDKSQDFVTLEEAISAIHECGGKAFLAHIFIYTWAEDKKELISDLITNYKFDGIECYYSKFSKEQIEYVVEVCKNNNLFSSGGSDSHGRGEPEIGIGMGNLSVPDDIISWAEKII